MSVVVECSGLNRVSLELVKNYMLMVGRIRISMTFAGRYEDHWEVSLSGFGIGMICEVVSVPYVDTVVVVTMMRLLYCIACKYGARLG